MDAQANIYDCERAAITSAVTEASETLWQSGILFSDSLSNISYVHGVQSGTHDFVDRDLFEMNEFLRQQGRKLYLYWIPSHLGIDGSK